MLVYYHINKYIQNTFTNMEGKGFYGRKKGKRLSKRDYEESIKAKTKGKHFLEQSEPVVEIETSDPEDGKRKELGKLFYEVMTRNHNTYRDSYEFLVKGVEFEAPCEFNCSFCGVMLIMLLAEVWDFYRSTLNWSMMILTMKLEGIEYLIRFTQQKEDTFDA